MCMTVVLLTCYMYNWYKYWLIMEHMLSCPIITAGKFLVYLLQQLPGQHFPPKPEQTDGVHWRCASEHNGIRASHHHELSVRIRRSRRPRSRCGRISVRWDCFLAKMLFMLNKIGFNPTKNLEFDSLS